MVTCLCHLSERQQEFCMWGEGMHHLKHHHTITPEILIKHLFFSLPQHLIRHQCFLFNLTNDFQIYPLSFLLSDCLYFSILLILFLSTLPFSTSSSSGIFYPSCSKAVLFLNFSNSSGDRLWSPKLSLSAWLLNSLPSVFHDSGTIYHSKHISCHFLLPLQPMLLIFHALVHAWNTLHFFLTLEKSHQSFMAKPQCHFPLEAFHAPGTMNCSLLSATITIPHTTSWVLITMWSSYLFTHPSPL